MHSSLKLSAVAVFAILQTVSAGAGAVVNGCVYLKNAPQQPTQFDITAGGPADHCMYYVGNSASVNVTTAGITCASLGYVESKASSTDGDLCATDRSIWSVSYTGGGFSQAIRTEWSVGNNAKVSSDGPQASLCDQQAVCTDNDVSWPKDSQGPIYVIFTPGEVKDNRPQWWPGPYWGRYGNYRAYRARRDAMAVAEEEFEAETEAQEEE